MMLSQQVFAQALLLAGELDDRQNQLLQVLCGVAASSLAARLREGITPEDCKADFIAAASLYALASLADVREQDPLEEFRAGDLTVRKRDTLPDAASRCLQRQAEMIIMPYLKDRFSFRGV